MMAHVEVSYERIVEIVREALPAADWQNLNAAVNAMLALKPDGTSDEYLDGWTDCQAAVVATLAVHLGIEDRI